MKILFQLFILFCAAILVKGCSSKKSDTIEFGRGGVMSVESKPGVYDFSEDGRYLWLTETNCYDLSGCSVDASKLRGASLPIARMRFKKHVMGPAWNYSFNNHAQKSEINKEKIESLIVQWGQTNLLRAAECELRCLSSQLTFPEISAPMVTAEVLSGDLLSGTHYMVLGKFPENDNSEIAFRALRISKGVLSLLGGEWAVSESIQRITSFSSAEGAFDVLLRFSDVVIDFESEHIVCSNEVYVSENELGMVVGDSELSLDEFCGHGFLSKNYFFFTGGSGGRNKFTARDYLFVYGFNEKRVVKAFKSKLRFLDEGYAINDIDVVLSADEKYLAIRYDGIITVYPL